MVRRGASLVRPLVAPGPKLRIADPCSAARSLSQLELTTMHLSDALELAEVGISKQMGEFSTAALDRAIDTSAVNKSVDA